MAPPSKPQPPLEGQPKTRRLLVALFVVWLVAWLVAGTFMVREGIDLQRDADHVARPTTPLERGGELRIEGTLEPGPMSTAPLGGHPCLAARTEISFVRIRRDSQGDERREIIPVATRRVGPPSLFVAVDGDRIELPLDRWNPRDIRTSRPGERELPDTIVLTPEELERVGSGRIKTFSIVESTLHGGEHVFLAGRLETSEGVLRVEADPELGEVLLHVGTQTQLVDDLRGSGQGLVVVGCLLALFVGPLPVYVALIVSWRKRRRSVVQAG